MAGVMAVAGVGGQGQTLDRLPAVDFTWLPRTVVPCGSGNSGRQTPECGTPGGEDYGRGCDGRSTITEGG
jgi:hypothetical protein